jgi:hypothetical protein
MIAGGIRTHIPPPLLGSAPCLFDYSDDLTIPLCLLPVTSKQ